MLLKRCQHSKVQRTSCDHPLWVQVKYQRKRYRQSLEECFPGKVVHGKRSRTMARDLERQFILDMKSGKHQTWREDHTQDPSQQMSWEMSVDSYKQGTRRGESH